MKKRLTLDFWAFGREGEAVLALVDEFEAQNPDIQVRVQQIPWSAAHEKLLTAYAGDSMPDVFSAWKHLASGIRRLASSRGLKSLDEQ